MGPARRALCASFGLAWRCRQQACSAGALSFAAAAPWPAQQRRAAPPLPWGPLGLRGLTSAPPPNNSIAGAQEMLDSLQAAKLRDELEAASIDRPYLSYPEFLEFIKQHNAADCDAEAEARADALTRAGVVLRLNSVVYLRPQEIAEMVYRALPTDPADARQRLAATEEQLREMDAQHRVLQRAAGRWPKFWLQTGCLVLFGQLVGFAYLTWWELSWDVMEPIAYMLSLSYSFLGYIYFLSKGSELDYRPFMKFWTEQQLRKKMEERGFDFDRYQSLTREAERYRRYLAAQAAAERRGAKIE
ncbi:calcium uniporter mitochondrial-like [Raphidocelis subcapitata]|uniref:Calcium uniporter mitochondrial-like n=1 Tax=Raphidocelis subcapitata TaxID=307507 RepID=A0A2V0P2T8_9CHLO|nr:calcium uniporter mitochondrial-like [Raphidocelis subcapitata]|eukprot:GBF91395.1 calcium uniporter mitochondrial-like [Raphidocelis subcapitata]